MSTPANISNLALDAVPAARITSLDDNSVAAKACRLHYPQVLGEVLEETDWGFGKVRRALAENVNERDAEWTYAYTRPADMAFPLRVIDANGMSYDFVFDGLLIYTNCTEALVEYVSTNTVAAQANALFRRYLIAQLAARLCVPITKDLKRAATLQQIAEVARDRAMASNFNREPHRYDDFIPDIVADRWGMDGSGIKRPAPATSYPDETFVEVFEETIDQ